MTLIQCQNLNLKYKVVIFSMFIRPEQCSVLLRKRHYGVQLSPDLVGHDKPLGCWPSVLLCEDAAGSMLGRHLIHLSLREPPESAPNKQLGESGDGVVRNVWRGKGWRGEQERTEGEWRSRVSEKAQRRRREVFSKIKNNNKKWGVGVEKWEERKGGKRKNGGRTIPWSAYLLEGLSLYYSSPRHFTFRDGKVTYCAQAMEQTNCQLVLSPTSGLSKLSRWGHHGHLFLWTWCQISPLMSLEEICLGLHLGSRRSMITSFYYRKKNLSKQCTSIFRYIRT